MLTEPDGTIWTGVSGYCLGEGWQDWCDKDGANEKISVIQKIIGAMNEEGAD